MTTPASVEAYLAALPEEARSALEQIRRTIRAAAPGAIEAISYGMPAFMDRGRLLVSYGAFKGHYSLFPGSRVVREALGDDLEPYVTGKATIRFPADRPLPVELVERIVQARLAERTPRDRS